MKVSRTQAALLALLGLYLLSGRAAQAQITWSPPQPVAPDTAAFVRQSWHSVAARDTALWVLWGEDRGPGQYYLKASRYSEAAGAWLEPELVAADTVWRFDVEAAVDADLNPWAGFGPSWSRKQGDTWISPQPLPYDTVGVNRWLDVCSDPEQGIWAVWVNYNYDEEYWFSFFSSYCRTDTWATPILFDEGIMCLAPYVPLITAPPGGEVRVVWLSAYSILSATWSGDSWVNREHVSFGWYPSVCNDSAGGTWLMWYDGYPGGSIRCARHDGTAWTDTWTLASGERVFCHKGMLCCDDQGRVWAMWLDYPEGICVRYFDGTVWSETSVVAPGYDTPFPRIVAAQGRVWVTWRERESDDRWLVYYSYTQGPGVAEQESRRFDAVRVSPSVVRAGTAIRLAGLEPGQTAILLDAAGRSVELPAVNAGSSSRTLDLSTAKLSPGVYFVRITGPGRPVSRKVLVVRGK